MRFLLFRVDKSHQHGDVSETIFAVLTISDIVIQQFLGKLCFFYLFLELTKAVGWINEAICLFDDTFSDGPYFEGNDEYDGSCNKEVLFDIFHQFKL